MPDEMSLPRSGEPDMPAAPAGEQCFDRLLAWGVTAVFLGSAVALWATNGASVFASAISGLWALCF